MREPEDGATSTAPALVPGAGAPRLTAELESRVRELVARLGRGGRAILPTLRLLREELGALDDDVLRAAAPLLEVRAADLKMLVASTGAFGLPGGVHEIVVCVHRHCRGRGALRLLQILEEETGASVGGARNGVRVDTALCLGACTIGPNVEVDGACWHAMTPEGLRRIVRALGRVRAASAAPS